jgi:hypothetical protein
MCCSKKKKKKKKIHKIAKPDLKWLVIMERVNDNFLLFLSSRFTYTNGLTYYKNLLL